MVALTLRGLGVPMGDGLAKNHEDLDFYASLHSHDLSHRSLLPLVNVRNQKFSTWGFKSPLLLENNALTRIIPMLRNPMMIFVFRNPLATAESRARRDGDDPVQALLRWDRLFGYMRDAISQTNCPVLAINYDASVARPGEFVRELAQILGLQVDTPDQLAAALISGDGYRMLPNENWTAEFINHSADASIAVLLAAQPGPAVLIEDGTVRYAGNIFFGPDHLIKLEPPSGIAFGNEVTIRLTYPTTHHDDLTGGGHNLYISFDSAFSLGLSRFFSRTDDGRLLRIVSDVPISGLALGISDDTEFGMLKDLPSLSLLSRPEDAAVAR
jgi:hypothetical protein